jgi:hypothetical protein
MKQNLYLLTPKDPDAGPWRPWYDTADGFVIRAWGRRRARHFAALASGDEDKSLSLDEKRNHSVWLDSSLVEAIEIATDVEGEEGIVLRSFRRA